MNRIFELLSSIRIIASPTMIGAIAGACVYLYKPGTTRLFIACGLGAAGLIIGIVWAVRVQKKYGATEYMAKLDGSPELDMRDKPEEKK
jgi:hypothetical protein